MMGLRKGFINESIAGGAGIDHGVSLNKLLSMEYGAWENRMFPF
jgi:hypothetical protein